MALIPATLLTGVGNNTVQTLTMTASDTFTFDPSKGQILVLRNGTAGALTVNIRGNAATTVPVPGIGNVDVSGGFSTGAIAVNGHIAIVLNTISQYLAGTTVTVTGGTGISANLYQSVA